MLAARLLRSRVVVAPAVALGARLASGSAADRLVDLAAAGGKQPGEDEGGMKIHHAQNELPDLPPIGGLGEDPVAAVLEVVAVGAKGAVGEAHSAAEGAMSEAADAVSGAMGDTYETMRGGPGAAAEMARGGVHAAAKSFTSDMGSGYSDVEEPGPDGGDAGNVAARGEAPDTSGHAMPGWPRWKKEADDSLQGGAVEPGIRID